MLTPSYLENVPQRLIELYAEIEADIIADMCARLSKMDFIPSAEWQYIKLIEMGYAHDYILERLSAVSGITKKEIEQLMTKSGIQALKADSVIYNKAGLSPPAINASPALQQVLQAGINSTNGLFENLTRTTANTATKQFENVLDRAWLQVTSGAFDYNTAIKSAVKELTVKGVQSVTYPTGHADYLDVSVRRATVTGVNQTALKLQDTLADELGSDLVETTAHSGARPSHAEWQGKVFSRSGTHEKYPDFRKTTGYGTGAGLGGWNCRHSFFPYFEGMGQVYTQTELDEMNAKKYEYNSEKLTEYEATQKQRAIERNIRKWKREQVGMESAGQPTEEASAKLAKWRGVQKDFIEQTGLKRQYDREKVYFAKTVDKSSKDIIIKSEKTYLDSKKKLLKHGIEDTYNTTNPNYGEGREYKINCQRCVSAYEARRRGFDVTAKPAIIGGADTLPYMTNPKGWASVYEEGIKNLETLSGNKGEAIRKSICLKMKSYGDGSRAIVRVQWQYGGGHVFIAEQVDGVTQFIDPQTSNRDVANYFGAGMIKPSSTRLLRIDDKKFTDLIEECVT